MLKLSNSIAPGKLYVISGTIQQCLWLLPKLKTKLLYGVTTAEIRKELELSRDVEDIVLIIPNVLKIDTDNSIYGIPKQIDIDELVYGIIVLDNEKEKSEVKELVKKLGDRAEYIKLTRENYKVEEIPEIHELLEKIDKSVLPTKERRDLINYYAEYPTTLINVLKSRDFNIDNEEEYRLKYLLTTLGTREGVNEWRSLRDKELGNYIYREIIYKYRDTIQNICGLDYYLSRKYIDKDFPEYSILSGEILHNHNGINIVANIYSKPYIEKIKKLGTRENRKVQEILGMFALSCYTINLVSQTRQIRIEESKQGNKYLAMFMTKEGKYIWNEFVEMLEEVTSSKQ